MNKADQWRAKARVVAAEEAVELSLPSGMVVMARRPGPALLAGMGRLPLHLTSRTVAVGESAEGDAIAFADFLRGLLSYCIVEPRISLTPTAEEIHPRDLPDRDLNFILAWAMRREEAEGLETFVESEQMTALVVCAKTWRVRPSQLLDIQDPMLALDLDLAATSIWNRLQTEALER